MARGAARQVLGVARVIAATDDEVFDGVVRLFVVGRELVDLALPLAAVLPPPEREHRGVGAGDARDRHRLANG